MIGNWDRAIGYVLEDEGPELNVGPSEPGGASKFGVSLTVLGEWLKRTATVDDVGAVDETLASKIYRARFADQIMFDTLPGGVDYRLLDISVNLGVAGATALMQAVLGDWQNSPMNRLVQLSAVDPAKVVHDLSVGWISIKSRSPSWYKFGHGWTNRNNSALARATAMVGVSA